VRRFISRPKTKAKRSIWRRSNARLAASRVSHAPALLSGREGAAVGDVRQGVIELLHRRGILRRTAKTIISPAALRHDLERARTVDYAVDDEGHGVGLRCIAAPSFDETSDRIAAVSASGPRARIGEQRIAQLGALMPEATSAI
jgi:IclR family transcriptional regulator, acetate operon repressor